MVDEAGPPVPCTELALSLLAGKRVRINYVDKSGGASLRWVVVKRVTSYHGSPALTAHCEMRKAERTFLLRRIRSCTSPDWPQVEAVEAARVAQAKRQERENAATSLRLLKQWVVGAVCAVLLSVVGCVYSNLSIMPASLSVSGYTRRDGTHVSSYSRRSAGSRKHDAPYEMLRGFCIFVILSGGAFLWWSRFELRRLKERSKLR